MTLSDDSDQLPDNSLTIPPVDRMIPSSTRMIACFRIPSDRGARAGTIGSVDYDVSSVDYRSIWVRTHMAILVERSEDFDQISEDYRKFAVP